MILHGLEFGYAQKSWDHLARLGWVWLVIYDPEACEDSLLTYMVLYREPYLERRTTMVVDPVAGHILH